MHRIPTLLAHAVLTVLHLFDFLRQHAFPAQVPPARHLSVLIPSPLYSAYTITPIHIPLARCIARACLKNYLR